jgi:hypothetical protein
MKRHAFILLLFITLPFFFNGQIEYDHDIKLPGNAFGGNAPRDIIYADGKIFVYTYKRILIFDDEKNHLGNINFSSPPSLGRFATLFSPIKGYVPDASMMAFSSSRHMLYFVTPNLQVLSVSTNNLDTSPKSVIEPPSGLNGKNLYGYTKLVYDDRTDRIYWSTLVQNGNYHSWNSVFGLYQKSQSSEAFTNIYYEFQNGADPIVGFWEVVQSYAFNPINNDFYISRKKKIDIFQIQNNATATLQKRIPITAGRIGKMIAVNDGGIQVVLALPSKLPYNLYVGDTLDEHIYWINTSDSNKIDSILAPSKMVADALYQADRNHLIACFTRDTNYYQLDTSNMDMAFYSFDNTDDRFELLQLLNTQAPDEVDTNYNININRPLKLLEKPNGEVLLSKKNEIIKIAYTLIDGYTDSSFYYARDSYFYKGVNAGQKTFIINSVNASLEVFKNSLIRETPIRIAYPAFNIAYNPVNRKLYFFNRLSTENTGFYIYNLNNDSVEAFVGTPCAIGDLVYNPVQNHILVSEFNKNVSVRVYSGDTDSLIQVLSFDFNNYLGRMFVAPNNKVYISANIKSDDNVPKLLVRNATDYSYVADIAVGLSENPDVCYNLRSHFCYNPYNDKVYATFAPFVHRKPPYQTSYNGSSGQIGDATLPSPDSTITAGRLISIDSQNNLCVIDSTIQNAGELICTTPDKVDAKSSYQGTLFINGGNGLHLLDCETNIVRPVGLGKIVDMDYSPQTNCLYVYHHFHYGQPGLDTNKIKVFKVKEDGSFNTIWSIDGFGASISYNKYDGQIYFYYRSDNRMLGSNPSKVIRLSAFADSNAQIGSVLLPTYSFMPEVVPQTNNAFFDPYGKAYFPNGMHSSVSVVNFQGGNEALHLSPGPNWISIPRLEANDGSYYLQSDTIPDVFNQSRFAIQYSNLELEHNRVKPNNETPFIAGWNDIWSFDPSEPDNQNAFSYRGYILELEPDGNNTMYMQGQIKDPATTFPLYKDKTNWVGYFLVQEQDVFDALGSFADSLNLIKHQDWTCVRGLPTGPEPNPESFWVCDKSVHNVKYADMLMLKGSRSDLVFQWSINGQIPGDENGTQNPDYYTYQEQPNYTPLVIELDSADNPLEVAAFVNDSCIGATVVEQGDSIVAMRAYMQGNAADSLTFEKYYGNKSTARQRINSYYVWDSQRQVNEKRTVRVGERKDRYFVSFRKQKEKEEESGKLRFNIWPNPTTSSLFYSVNLKNEATVNISVFSITGKLVAETEPQAAHAGILKGNILLKDFSGKNLKPGVYLVKLVAGGLLETKKVIVN